MAPAERSDEERKRPALASCYLVTIKRNALEFTRKCWLDAQYTNLVKRIRGEVEWSDQVSYELDSLNRLHLHTIVTSKSPIFYKKYVRKGWHIHFQPFERKDMSRVYEYIMKHNQDKHRIEQLEDESFIYQLDDPFIDSE